MLPILKIVKHTNNVQEIIKSEIDYIEKYKDEYQLTNTTKGGEYLGIGTPIDVFDLEGNFIESYNSMIEFAELYNLGINSVSSISAVCKRKRNYAYNFIFRYSGDIVTEEDLKKLKENFNKRDPKHIVIFDLEGNILGEFDSIHEASRHGFGSVSQIMSARNNTICCSIYNNLIGNSIEDYPKLITNYLSRHQNKENAK